MTRTPGTRNTRRNRRRIVAAARISRRYLRMGSPRRAGSRCAVFRRRKLAVTKGHKLSIRRSRTPQPLRSGSQQRTRIARVYRARSTRSPVERHASLDADGPSPNGGEVAAPSKIGRVARPRQCECKDRRGPKSRGPLTACPVALSLAAALPDRAPARASTAAAVYRWSKIGRVAPHAHANMRAKTEGGRNPEVR